MVGKSLISASMALLLTPTRGVTLAVRLISLILLVNLPVKAMFGAGMPPTARVPLTLLHAAQLKGLIKHAANVHLLPYANLTRFAV